MCVCVYVCVCARMFQHVHTLYRCHASALFVYVSPSLPCVCVYVPLHHRLCVVPIELKIKSEHSDAGVDPTGSDHPPCYGPPIWLGQLVWQHCSLSLLVLVRLLAAQGRNRDIQAARSDANAAKEEKQKKR